MKNNCILLAIIAMLVPYGAMAQSELYPQHFNLNEVRLADGPMKQALDINNELLLQYDVDRLMTPFVRQSGLSSKSGSPYYGWVNAHPSFPNWGLDSWSLEGHVGGHYLSALALAYAATEDEAVRAKMKERLDYCVSIMKDCQDAFDGNTDGMEGFIGGQPINQIWTGLYRNDLTEFRRFGGWVPFYCQHKVLAGMRDAWVYAGNETAKECFRKLCDWSVNVVSKLSYSDMQTVLGWEHGGMNETLADAYRLFGDKKYLEGAKKYSHRYEIDGMQGAEGQYSRTFLNGQHANTQVPKFIGFERIWQEAPEDASLAAYKTAVRNFWDDVATNRTVCIGGNSVGEHFLASDRCSQYITNLDGPESCNSNNMLKLSENLFNDTHDAKYVDFYEQTMWNHILSTQDPHTGGYVYFTSLRPQSYRIYSQVNQGMWCCVGTGMENHSKYGHFIYTHDGDKTLYVNLFTPSELVNEKYAVKQETDFPYGETVKLTINKSGTFALAVRHPAWAGEKFSVAVNGVEQKVEVVKGVASYAAIQREWTAGDVVTVTLPMELRYEECPNYTDYIAFKYGPILLAAKTTASSKEEALATGLEYEMLQREYADDSRMGHAPGSNAVPKTLSSSPLLIGERSEVLQRIKPVDKQKLEFAISARFNKEERQLTLVPFYSIHHARYTCYWYQQTEEEYMQSEMGKADAEEQALLSRTIDFVGTGEQQSEAGHDAKYSVGSTSGSYNGEFYRDAQAGEYIQYTLSNPDGETERLAVMCRFTTADKGRKASIYIDGTKIADVTVPSSHKGANEMGFYNIEYPVPAELMIGDDGEAKKSIVFRIVASSSTYCPGLYYLRLVRNYQDNSYLFKAKDWVTGDGGRVSQNNFTYDEQANTITVKAGTGNNNVCLKLNDEKCDYMVSKDKKYLVVIGTNLKTTAGASYLWWLNGVNKGSSIAPTTILSAPFSTLADEIPGAANLDKATRLIAWDMTKSGLDANNVGEQFSICNGWTIFGLTSTTGTSVISHIGFHSSVAEGLTAVGIDRLEQEGDGAVDVYSIDGKLLKKGVKNTAATTGLDKGIYLVGNKKVAVE